MSLQANAGIDSAGINIQCLIFSIPTRLVKMIKPHRSASDEVPVEKSFGVVLTAQRLEALPPGRLKGSFGARRVRHDVGLAHVMARREPIQCRRRLAVPCG